MSFLNELQILLERKDIKTSNNILKMTKKIISFLKRNNKRLFSVGYYKPGNGYYIKYNIIDPKSGIDDLYIALVNKSMASLSKDNTIINPAALATYKDNKTGKNDYVLRLYIFDSNEDEKNVSLMINKLIASPSWNSNIYHELTHYLDNKRQKVVSFYNIKDYLNDSDVKNILEKIKKYHNLSDEVNAYFMQA
jgi:hypothetical protein